VKRKPGPKPYISRAFQRGIRFGLFPFRSLLLGESRLVSFPPPTKMLPFGGFPLREGAPWLRGVRVGSPIEVSPVLRLHAPTRGGIAACRALLRLSSRAILQTAFAWSGRLVVSVWRLVNFFCWCVVFLPVCGVILSFCFAQFTASLLHHCWCGVASHF
jgi:hypothetical protein